MNLRCAVCGGDAPGKQWWNQDKGYGICARCFASVAERDGQEEAERSYGRPGVHHSEVPKLSKQTTARAYRLDCREWNEQHVRFVVFDPKGASCGTLTVETADVFNFIKNSWHGSVVWNGKVPEAVAV